MATPLKYSAKGGGTPEPKSKYAEYTSRPPVDGCRPGGKCATTQTSHNYTSPLAHPLGSRGEGSAVVGSNPNDGAQSPDDRSNVQRNPGTPPDRQRRGVTTPTPPQTGPGLRRHHSPNTPHNPGRNNENTNQPRLRNMPNENLTQPRRKRKQFKIASLNMNGRGDAHDKWGSINNMMKKRGVAILALQETHPTDKLQETVSRRFRNSLTAVHSANLSGPLSP